MQMFDMRFIKGGMASGGIFVLGLACASFAQDRGPYSHKNDENSLGERFQTIYVQAKTNQNKQAFDTSLRNSFKESAYAQLTGENSKIKKSDINTKKTIVLPLKYDNRDSHKVTAQVIVFTSNQACIVRIERTLKNGEDPEDIRGNKISSSKCGSSEEIRKLFFHGIP
jgi:hypothetical protein